MNMTQDHRCCGSGTCIINAEGWCWCGQRWKGDQLVQPQANGPSDTEPLQVQKDDDALHGAQSLERKS